ncbi:tetratricopeptide repeat protein [candidate division GN15 bacterium]|nr:tetratricopeptide repeat protein [candidate division GN15 bacterium]
MMEDTPAQTGRAESFDGRKLADRLAADGYWPAQAAVALQDGKFSHAVRLCKEGLAEQPRLVSGRLIYAAALLRAGQEESAAEELHRVLALDPDHVVALKLLGDIRFHAGDEPAALANYRRILEIDPFCRGLSQKIERPAEGTTRTIKLTRHAEPSAKEAAGSLRDIPFVTETIGDLYLSQGHHRLAREVFRRLLEKSDNPRLADKLALAENGVERGGGKREPAQGQSDGHQGP